jgi:hypothetical protein
MKKYAKNLVTIKTLEKFVFHLGFHMFRFSGFSFFSVQGFPQKMSILLVQTVNGHGLFISKKHS